MAEENQNSIDYHEHEKTYALFLGLCKWTVIICVATLVLMAIFLA